jgi:hypothetical protein
MPQNPTNQPLQQPSQMGGKGAGKGGMQMPSASQPSTEQILPSAQPQAGGGKGNSPNPNQLTPDGGNMPFGGNMTLSSTSGQPQTGQPNPYPNTTGSWDNSNSKQIPENHPMAGKGKGA